MKYVNIEFWRSLYEIYCAFFKIMSRGCSIKETDEYVLWGKVCIVSFQLSCWNKYFRHYYVLTSVVEPGTLSWAFKREPRCTKHGQGSIGFTQVLIIAPAASPRTVQNVRALPENSLSTRSTHFSPLTTLQGLPLTRTGTRPQHVYLHTSAFVYLWNTWRHQ